MIINFLIIIQGKMHNTIILNQLQDKIEEMGVEENAIIVLKGIPISAVDTSIKKINLESVVDNKMGYFMSIYGKRKYLSYEEFLLMSDFVVAQYKYVYIFNNNIYMEQYPIEECFTNEVREGILNHFKESEDEEDDDSYIGDIDEYISIFEGIKENNGYLLGTYSEVRALSNSKVILFNLFDRKSENIITVSESDTEFYDLIDETDYISLLKLLFTYPDEIRIRVANYTSDLNKLKNHIALVAHYWEKYTNIFYVQTAANYREYEHRDEYGKILKEYWGFPSYRSLPVYDMAKLEQGDKTIIQVSQEQIISNIVEQVELCGDAKNFRDIFVTAPTGAGKSVMFQVPAIYLAENYNLLTIVISPLIGLMNDQVKNLELKKYKHAKTINSDISPIIKADIIDKVADGQYDILYISPETLLSRSDVEQLIGNRTIGMIVIDEAHIVTTWGKQFRPDYWYLGDHIRKLRKKQIKSKGKSFVIATFTATAIYRGVEDMYTETINSLHMLSPITYLGYVKRRDINIVINKSKKGRDVRTEYELNKFEEIENLIKRAIITNKKTLIYFPTVALINRCYEYLRTRRHVEKVTIYHGNLNKDEKQENYEKFCDKNKLIMLATKAFGMGIDINDIEIVAHLAPTGNVCDYVQEIGRAARKVNLEGEALYYYNPKDFKHINRLHGLSTIQHYQLVMVIEKIEELYRQSLQSGKRKDLTKKRNAMLIDAENFSYIFGSPISDEDSNLNKVKTALLLIQKDFETKVGFSPIMARPIPMFSIGFFEISPGVQRRLQRKYPGVVEEIESDNHICRVWLSTIWNKEYKEYSFPKFKYFLYSKNSELNFVNEYPMTPALCVNVNLNADYSSIFRNIWDSMKAFIFKKVQLSEHTAVSEIVDALEIECQVNRYKAQTIAEVVIASMDAYRKNFARTTSPIVQEKVTKDGKVKYQFNVAVNTYFRWVEMGFKKIESNLKNRKLYLINDNGCRTKEYNLVLGILESMGVLTFEMLGGANSQIYIYINQSQALQNIISAPRRYQNRLLKTVAERHLISVKMLSYLYESDFSSSQMWDVIEDYFLGKIPEEVKRECRKERPEMFFE